MPTRSKEGEVTRRDFLTRSIHVTSGLTALAGAGFLPLSERVFGANARVAVAVCGLHGRGVEHLRAYSRLPQAEVVALCDVDENVLRQRLAEMDHAGLPKPKTYVDIRKLLDDKSIDAVSIATPNHWHSLMAIWSCQAGKDVYVEKPCSHNLWEGHQLVRAAQRYERVVQHGTQSRSSKMVRAAVQKMREGLLGDVYMSRGLCFKWRDTIGHAPVEPIPSGVDYDLWTGPAPAHPFTRNRFHYNWHWLWAYGNGDLGNQGVHQVDLARWGLGVGFPNRISAIGGHFMFDDDQETPNTLNCAFQFDLPDGKHRLLEFEVRHWISNHESESGAASQAENGESHPRLGPLAGSHNTIGNLFYGPKGYMAITDGDAPPSYHSWLGKEQERGPGSAGVSGDGEVEHFTNFLDAVISRNKANLNAPIEEGHISCALVHLANGSYRLGRTLNFDPEAQEVIGDPEAAKLLREEDRGYRAPFVVPERM